MNRILVQIIPVGMFYSPHLGLDPLEQDMLGLATVAFAIKSKKRRMGVSKYLVGLH